MVVTPKAIGPVSFPSRAKGSPAVYFYMPPSAPRLAALPSTVENYWQQLLSLRQQPSFGSFGQYNWTVQTYLYLKADGISCELTNTLPRSGIVLAHRDFLADAICPGPALLLVCLLSDREAPAIWAAGRHPYAQIHVVQNPQDPLLAQPTSLWASHYIPLWPQPNLIPRDAARGDRFERAAYFGLPENLATELKSPGWAARLASLGLTWQIMPQESWHDYRDVDVTVAVRSFDRRAYRYKPPSKLVNAWLAGVPAVLGRESAYQSQRQGPLDYLEVASVEKVFLALKRLRDDVALRRAIMENGERRAAEFKPGRLVALWRGFLYDQAVPSHDRWLRASLWGRYAFLARRYLATRPDHALRRIRRWRSRLSRARTPA